MDNELGIEMEVRGEIRNGYRLKLSVNSIGMYVDGFTAVKSPRNASGFWVQPPRQEVNGEWKRMVEFALKTEFWATLEEKSLEAINGYNDTDTNVKEITDEELTDEGISEALDMALVDFGLDEKTTPKAIPWMDPKDRRR